MSIQIVNRSENYKNHQTHAEGREKRRIQWIVLRVLGNFGSQGNGLLVPLLIFYMTHSATAAGWALAMEWAPKIIIYLTGGMVLDFFGRKKVHGYLEMVRCLAWVGFLAAAMGFVKHFEWVAVCAAIYQCSNAISNIMFETMVTREWDKEEHAHGYARLLKADQAGCFLMLGLSVMLHGLLNEHHTIMALSFLGLLVQGKLTIQAFNFHELQWDGFCVQDKKLSLESRVDQQASLSVKDKLIKGVDHFKKQIQWSCHGSLLGLALNHLMVRLPVTVAFAMMPLILAEHSDLSGNVSGWFSWILLMKAGISWGLIALIQSLIGRWGCEKHLFFWGLAGSLMGSMMLTNHTMSNAVLMGALMLLNAAVLLMTPFARTLRQGIISKEIPMQHQSGVSGVMISVEALVYIAVTVLMKGCDGSLDQTIRYCCHGACLGAVGLIVVLGWHAKKEKQQKCNQKEQILDKEDGGLIKD